MNQSEYFTKEIGRIDEDCQTRLHEEIDKSNLENFKKIRNLGITHVLVILAVLALTAFTLYAVDKRGFFAVCFLAALLEVLIVYSLCKSLEKAVLSHRDKENSIFKNAIGEITEVARNERKKDYLKNSYIEELSYDIDIPLSAIIGLSAKIFRDSTEMNIIESAAKLGGVMGSLHTYVNDLCIASRLGLDKLEIMNAPYDIGIMLCDIENLGIKVADEKGIKLNFDINNDIPAILMGDENHIELIVLKLIANALKYTDEGTVTLTVGFVEVSDKEILLNISVRDTGRGIKEEDIEKFFSKNKTAEEALLEGGSLAMCMSKTLLEKMDSELRVESKFTQGSEFRFMVKQEVIDKTPVGKREDAIARLHKKDMAERGIQEETDTLSPTVPKAKEEPSSASAPAPAATPIKEPTSDETAKEQPVTTDDAFLKKLSVINDLSVTDGIKNAGSEEIYKKVITDFGSSASSKADDIEMLFEKEDIKNYTIEVHALKSAARIIGYKKLSKLAEALEDAGNANDLVCIKNATGELVRLYRNIAAEIEKAEDDGAQKELIDDESLKDAVRSLKEFAEVFDFDSVDFVMKELKKYRIPENFKDKYSKLKTLVAQVDRDAIIELLKE
ncbi:MAG: Hpt domain-containing protein [Lachnospiraceae bacterium]|nr:Hpt domain-containing protein [Lachnospiraceae bacterium]